VMSIHEPEGSGLSRRQITVALGVGLATPGLALAQTVRSNGGWPQRPVNLIVGFPPGGQTDLAARVLQNALQVAFGQPVPIENRAGAGGNIATEQVLRARPDGYTLCVGNVGTFVLNPHTMPSMGFDPRELVPIGLMLQSPLLLMVHSGIPARTFPEWLEWMKSQQPGGIDVGTTSAGGIGHATAERFRVHLGGNPVFNMIHYRGSGPALQDFIGGRYQTQFEAPSLVHGFVQEKRLRPIFVTSPNRNPAFPDVPTADEVGLPGFHVSAWVGLFGPEIVRRANAALNEACQDPIARQRLAERGDEIGGGTEAEFGEQIKREYVEWGKVAREANIRAE
jgi:tripartite-type tricarboxylate transporter receptor subunit TctC